MTATGNRSNAIENPDWDQMLLILYEDKNCRNTTRVCVALGPPFSQQDQRWPYETC